MRNKDERAAQLAKEGEMGAVGVSQEKGRVMDAELREAMKDTIARIRRRVAEKLADAAAGQPIVQAAAEIGMMPFELEALAAKEGEMGQTQAEDRIVLAKFRKRPVEVVAARWFPEGPFFDGVVPLLVALAGGARTERTQVCDQCERRLDEHGWVGTLEGGHAVCPGDWIVTGVKGERYPVKPDVFEKTYEPAE